MLHNVFFCLGRCREEEFYSILPRQPYRVEGVNSEVRLEFEAVMLDVNKDTKTNELWVHARIKACVHGADCDPVICSTTTFCETLKLGTQRGSRIYFSSGFLLGPLPAKRCRPSQAEAVSGKPACRERERPSWRRSWSGHVYA